MKVALYGKKVFAALTDDDVDTEVTDEALSLIILSLADSALRAVQNYTTAKDACEKLELRYALKSLINTSDILNSLLNAKVQKEQQMSDRMAKLEAKFSILTAIRTTRVVVIDAVAGQSDLYGVKNTCNMIIDGGVSEHVIASVSVLQNVYEVETITVVLAVGSKVTTRQNVRV